MKYFKISRTKEYRDVTLLIKQLSSLVNKTTVIVNCSPDYSSMISQRLIHAYYDNPIEMQNFDMPYPNTEFEKQYPKYCKEYINGLDSSKQYLFLDSGVLRGKNFNTLSEVIQNGNKHIRYSFASLYVQDDSMFVPHHYVQKFNRKKDGMLLFWWENINCNLFD